MRFGYLAAVGIVCAATIGCGDDGGHSVPDTVIDSAPTGLGREVHSSIEFHAEGTANRFLCSLDGATPTECESPVAVDVTDGAHTFDVAATFGQLIDSSPAHAEWTVDATAPDTVIDAAPPAHDNATMPMITFSAPGETGATFECQLDGAAFAACTSPDTLTVSDGSHTFAVRALDAAGNVDATPATVTWAVDTSTPDTTITAGPAEGGTSGPNVMFSFTSNKPNSTFECSADSGAFADCTAPHSLALPDGAHTFAVRAKDAQGILDPSPAMRAWTVDATGPTVTITMGPTNPTNDSTPTVEFTASEANSTFECQLDGGAFAACATPFTAGTPLAEGSHTFAVRATDPNSNTGAATSATFVVDLTPPTLVITSAPATLSNDTTPTVAFTAGADAVMIACQVDSGAFAACTSPFTTTVVDGMHVIRVRATDAAGNPANVAATFTVDSSGPTVTITTPPAALSNDTTPTTAFTVTPTPMTVTCKVDAAAPVGCGSPFTTTVVEGTHTVVVTAVDALGNSGSAMTMFTVDTTPPVVTITSGPTGPTNTKTPTFGFTATGATTIDCRVDTGTFATCATSFTTATLAEGPHTFEVRATDNVGNPASATRTFTVDTVAPTVTVTSQPGAMTNNPSPVIQFTTAGNPTSVTCALDGGMPVTCTTSFTPSSPLADGSHTVVITATDAAGNAGMATVTFVVDQTPPTVAFTQKPPVKWPVNYFDFIFTATGATTTTCTLNGTNFTPCTPGAALATTVPYAVQATFVVTAKDAAGNTATATATWTPARDLVLHYPFEKGSTANTSLLAQVGSLSPNGSLAPAPYVGGYAGAALGRTVTAHTYAKTNRALSSSSDATYTGSFWVRPTATPSGTLLSTKTATGGFAVTMTSGNGPALTFQTVEPNGTVFTASTLLQANRWSHVAFRTTGTAKDLQIYVNAALAATVDATTATGFGAGQATDLTVGPFAGLDLDDVRFFNSALSDTLLCTQLANGVINGNGGCNVLAPMYEFDFEGSTIDTGTFGLTTNTIPGTFTSLSLGQAIKLGTVTGGINGIASATRVAEGRSFSMWFSATAGTSARIFDYSRNCDGQALPLCGVTVNYDGASSLTVYTGIPGESHTITLPNVQTTKPNTLLITETRNGANTATVTFFLNGGQTGIAFSTAGDIYGPTSGNLVQFPSAGTTVDEFEFWPANLLTNFERLCEIGFDGQYDPAFNSCSLANN